MAEENNQAGSGSGTNKEKEVVLAVRWPVDGFRPGDGLPEITRQGTTLTSDQADKVREAAQRTGVRVYEVKGK